MREFLIKTESVTVGNDTLTIQYWSTGYKFFLNEEPAELGSDNYEQAQRVAEQYLASR